MDIVLPATVMIEPNLSIADDAALMCRAADGDHRAWQKIVSANLPIVHRVAYRLSLDQQIAEDITQECFLRLWKLADSWQPKARISTWLCHVARNLAIDNIRRRQRETVQDMDTEAQTDGLTPWEHLARKETEQFVEDALLDLPERQRLAILLVHYGECSGSKAASVMGVSVEALESLLSRARRSLKAFLVKRTGEKYGNA